LCEQVFSSNIRHNHPAAAYVFLEQAELLYERNDLDGARKLLSKTIQVGENVDRIVNVVRACQLLARLHQALGDQVAASQLIEQADQLFNRSTPRYQVMHRIEYEYYRFGCMLSRQNIQAVRQWADEYKTRRKAIDHPWALLNELAYAHIMLLNGKPSQALAILKSCEKIARDSGLDGWRIRSLSLQSLCFQALKDEEKALETLSQVFYLAEPQGYVRTFLDCGAPMQGLLQLAVSRGLRSDYIGRLLAAFSEEQGEGGIAKQYDIPAQPSPVEPLTDRELSILRLMAAGLSHPDIAGELHLSANTIKWYSSQIYSKLGVHRRAHAVSRARELHIL
jgi:LuxR family maltose regulon positive regulatory protein